MLTTMKRLIIVALLCSACGGSSPTTPTPTPTPPPPAAPTVSSVSVSGGGCSNGGTCSAPTNFQLTAIATLSNGTTQTVTTQAAWSSTNPSVASVSGSGTVTVQNAGGADITAVYQGKLGGVTVSVPPAWSQAGTGNNVFDMPTFVSRVRITGRYTGFTTNFIIKIGGRLTVNELLGTGWPSTTYDGTHAVTGGQVEITNSSGVAWTFTQVR